MTHARLIAAAALIAASTTLQAAPQGVADPAAPDSHFAPSAQAFARKAYAAAARDLKDLAGKVRTATVKDAAALDTAFSKAKRAVEANRREAPIPGDKGFISGGDQG